MSAADAKVKRAAQDLEGPICDLVSMIDLLVAHYERLLRYDTKEEGEVSMYNWEADLAMFGIYHISHMADALKDRFYAAIEGKAAADA